MTRRKKRDRGNPGQAPKGFMPGLLGDLRTPADVFHELLSANPSEEAREIGRRMGVWDD